MIRSLARLRPFVSPYKRRLTLGISAFGISRLFEGLIPIFVGIGIDRMSDGNIDMTMPVAGILGCVLARYIVVTYARFVVRSAGQIIAFDLRQSLYASLQGQGTRFFSRYSIGDMMTRAIADIGIIQRLIAMGSILFVILIYATVVGFGFMLYLSPSLTLLLLPPLPIIFFYARWSSRQMGVASQQVQDRLSDLGTHVQENLSGIRTIQAMVQEDNEIKRFGRTNQQYANAFYRQAEINSLMAAWMPSLAAVCSITILGYGSYLVLNGTMSVGKLVAFFMYVNMVVQPFRVAGFVINLFQRAAVSCERLFEVIALPPEITDAPSGRAPAQIKGRIELRDLTFSYDATLQPALNAVNLIIEPGESISIMGRVGCGKTTLLKQIVRLVDTPRNSVLIDGHDVHDYPLAQLRSQIAMVPQDTFLFGEPLKDNLTYDDPNRELDRIWAAATSADLKSTIEDFPEQLDTIVGERGVTLSGGQKQRATLARGLIRESPVLILDDCFSSVDTETEEHILSELKRLRRGQTTILVSHRVSTARHSDRIVVMDQGSIVEMGSHAELVAAGGLYAELERIQREGADESDYDMLGATT
ncbi:MAG: ABC transporter ATP-binding protein [Gammaproteobacteria bacterium]|nr:ABC transporter ATP-binding protein [Gammaproteobacteria bacterium]